MELSDGILWCSMQPSRVFSIQNKLCVWVLFSNVNFSSVHPLSMQISGIPQIPSLHIGWLFHPVIQSKNNRTHPGCQTLKPLPFPVYPSEHRQFIVNFQFIWVTCNVRLLSALVVKLSPVAPYTAGGREAPRDGQYKIHPDPLKKHTLTKKTNNKRYSNTAFYTIYWA